MSHTVGIELSMKYSGLGGSMANDNFQDLIGMTATSTTTISVPNIVGVFLLGYVRM